MAKKHEIRNSTAEFLIFCDVEFFEHNNNAVNPSKMSTLKSFSSIICFRMYKAAITMVNSIVAIKA